VPALRVLLLCWLQTDEFLLRSAQATDETQEEERSSGGSYAREEGLLGRAAVGSMTTGVQRLSTHSEAGDLFFFRKKVKPVISRPVQKVHERTNRETERTNRKKRRAKNRDSHEPLDSGASGGGPAHPCVWWCFTLVVCIARASLVVLGASVVRAQLRKGPSRGGGTHKRGEEGVQLGCPAAMVFLAGFS
jgi:hypothetical protein